MADLQSFLQDASSNIGVSTDSAKSATGALLDLVGKQAGSDELGALVDKIPGAESLLGASGSGGGSGGGGLGGLTGGIGKAVSGAIGGKLGGAASVLGAFEGAGLDMNQSTKFISMFFSFAKSQAGSGVVEKILGKMPEIKKLLG